MEMGPWMDLDGFQCRLEQLSSGGEQLAIFRRVTGRNELLDFGANLDLAFSESRRGVYGLQCGGHRTH